MPSGAPLHCPEPQFPHLPPKEWVGLDFPEKITYVRQCGVQTPPHSSWPGTSVSPPIPPLSAGLTSSKGECLDGTPGSGEGATPATALVGGASVHQGSAEGRQLLRAFLWVMRCTRPRGILILWSTWLHGLSGFWTVLLTTSDLVGVTLEQCPSLLFVALIF